MQLLYTPSHKHLVSKASSNSRWPMGAWRPRGTRPTTILAGNLEEILFSVNTILESFIRSPSISPFRKCALFWHWRDARREAGKTYAVQGVCGLQGVREGWGGEKETSIPDLV